MSTLGQKCRNAFKATILPIALIIFLPLSSEGEGGSRASGIQVELIQKTPLSLRVTVRSGVKSTVKISRHELPWGSAYRMVLVAAVGEGKCLDRRHSLDDPGYFPVTIEPNATLSGEIDVESLFPDLRDFLKISDVHLFWAYESPEALQIDRWSGGWIRIPKQQR